ncbi:hypothetical protein C8Q78DRAFT_1051989 [Trametes maxima]|nr:hypothetical protein C8Q78DRAFT_1051989 [Trametes maxima]
MFTARPCLCRAVLHTPDDPRTPSARLPQLYIPIPKRERKVRVRHFDTIPEPVHPTRSAPTASTTLTHHAPQRVAATSPPAQPRPRAPDASSRLPTTPPGFFPRPPTPQLPASHTHPSFP